MDWRGGRFVGLVGSTCTSRRRRLDSADCSLRPHHSPLVFLLFSSSLSTLDSQPGSHPSTSPTSQFFRPNLNSLQPPFNPFSLPPKLTLLTVHLPSSPPHPEPSSRPFTLPTTFLPFSGSQVLQDSPGSERSTCVRADKVGEEGVGFERSACWEGSSACFEIWEEEEGGKRGGCETSGEKRVG